MIRLYFETIRNFSRPFNCITFTALAAGLSSTLFSLSEMFNNLKNIPDPYLNIVLPSHVQTMTVCSIFSVVAGVSVITAAGVNLFGQNRDERD